MKIRGIIINKKAVCSFELFILIVSVFAFSYLIYSATPVSAQSTTSNPSVCCEKTKEGALCVNTVEEDCDANFLNSPTSCQTTSYCRLGTCYDSDEGICIDNTPQSICNEKGGTWDSRSVGEVPQCQLGCCIIGDQAAFVPLVRCKKLSSFFGVENNYRNDIGSEVACIAEAQGQDKGACVYEKDFERICEFTTRADCGAGEVVEVVEDESSFSGERKFYKDYLCSAGELNTACARQVSTKCDSGKVYWTDSCGNLENVYSVEKDVSWNNGRVAEPDEICSPNDGSNRNCGNCEYLLGSRCAPWEGVLGLGKPADSDYYCQKTECVDRNEDLRINGESWCVYDGTIGNGLDAVGSRHYREICIDGEVVVEPCADYRNEICIYDFIETDIRDFGTAACRVNRWHDCTSQTDYSDCINVDKRDCVWKENVTGLWLSGGDPNSGGTAGFSNPATGGGGFGNPTLSPEILLGPEDEKIPDGICVPSFSPGLAFWEESSAEVVCGQASAKCTVTYEKALYEGSWKVKGGGECLEEDWAASVDKICASLGDCGGYVNYQGVYTTDGFDWRIDGEEQKFSPNTVNKIKQGFVGFVSLTLFQKVLINMFLPFVSGQSGGVAEEESLRAQNMNRGHTGPVNNNRGNTINTARPEADLVDEGAGASSVCQGGECGDSYLSQFFHARAGYTADAVLTGIQWAVVAYFAGQMLGNMFGFSDANTQALSTALAAGAFVYNFLDTYKGSNTFFTETLGGAEGYAGAWGLLVAAIVFVAMYREEEVKVVTFDCLPWQAPNGGQNCEICNDDSLPCSEYRCKSLGQSCELLNPGTGQERCVNVHPNDVSPPIIRPSESRLTSGHQYTDVKISPPGPGFKIVNLESSDGCLKAYTPLTFGVDVDEPAQCKIDFKHTTSFDEMSNFIGGKNLYAYNHTENFVLPNGADFENSSIVLENGKDLTFFVRCKDRNGNENSAEYAVRFCIDPSPDTTAPTIEATSVLNSGCVAEDVSNANVNFYTNEPSNCKWDTEDQSYDLMDNEMVCSNQLYQFNALQLFTCEAELSGIARDGTDFFIRCKDQPRAEENNRNVMVESYKFNLRGSTGLKMKNLNPNGTIFGGVSPAPVELYVETLFGCNNGQAVCFFSESGNTGDFIQFFDTNSEDGINTQPLNLVAGDHTFYISCVDAGGNKADSMVNFNLDIDENAPVVARVYQEDSMLKIVTVRDSECVYSLNNCDFSFSEGTQMPYSNTTVHVAEWNKENTYHIKCRDQYLNEDADCSLIVRPSSNFL